MRMACARGLTAANQSARLVTNQCDNLSRLQTLADSATGATCDGLDRRIRTTYTPDGGATLTTTSMFDPEVEFLELGLAIDGAWNWKVYGPDLSGSYAGLEGLGGLEAVIGSSGVTRGIINNWFGNTVGYVGPSG